MTSQPLVSVVIPVYNVEKYLHRCLDSVLSQTLKDMEIICIDDGSTDNGPAIVEEYAQKEPRLRMVQQKNGGLSVARNTGLVIASGRYIAFLDSDDWLEPETYAAAASIMSDDAEIDYVNWCFSLDYEEPPKSPELGLAYDKINVFKGKIQVDKKVITRTFVTTWNKMFKLELIKKYGLTFPPGLISEDVSFWYQYAVHAGHGYYFPEKRHHYFRGRPDSITNDMRQRKIPEFNHFKIFQNVYDHYQQCGLLDADGREIISILFMEMYLASLRHTNDFPGVRAQAGEMARDLNLVNLPNNYIDHLKKGIDHELADYSLMEKIFSLKNRDKYKILTLLGTEFRFNRKQW